MNPWYKVVTLRKEVREGRSFSPDEFAIALEQVVAGTAPADYSDPEQFFSRTCFTRALRDHSGMALRRLAGKTENTAPVLTLVTQFGGGKTHTLASLYHLAKAGHDADKLPGVSGLLKDAGVTQAPSARVGVFVGNAWDPQEGRETPWIDLARQLAGDQGVAALGSAARTTPPGTDALSRVFAAANGPVLLLFDEVLNFINRHRSMAEPFYAFLQNLTVSVTGTTRAAAVISLPRSQIEMTEWDQDWQERITKVVRRVARDLIANDESEISEVVRLRLFEDLGRERVRQNAAKAYAEWCFERSARLPAEWTAVDTSTTGARAKDFLRKRFEACYPFHPATLSVFQRKWRALPQFQQTRGALAMLAQWISWAARQQFQEARNEPLITLGSAPLHVPDFRAVVLGQLGEQRLDAAIEADIAGEPSHAKSLDADTKDALRDIHARVGAAVLFESSGGQIDKVARLPELRFALGEPEVETTTIDTAAAALEGRGFFIRKVGADGYRIHYQATLRKVVSDRLASLDEKTEILPAIRRLVETEFGSGASDPVVYFPEDGDAVQDSPRLTLVVIDPKDEWDAGTRKSLGEWTTERGKSPRLYRGSLVWCVRKPGRELRESVEKLLAWQRVKREVEDGTLGAEFDKANRNEVHANIRNAEDAARDQVWAGYRFVSLWDTQSNGNMKVIDLGAGHASGSDTLSGRVKSALKSEALLNDSVGAGYIERHWPRAFEETKAWPLMSLRQSFLDGALTRLPDPDAELRRRIVEFVGKGEFGLASGDRSNGQYERTWYKEPVGPEEVVFESDVFLLTRSKAEELRAPPEPVPPPDGTTPTPSGPIIETAPDPGPIVPPPAPPPEAGKTATLRIAGAVPPESWNKLGTKIIPKLRTGDDLRVGIEFSVKGNATLVNTLQTELRQALDDLGLRDLVRVEPS